MLRNSSERSSCRLRPPVPWVTKTAGDTAPGAALPATARSSCSPGRTVPRPQPPAAAIARHARSFSAFTLHLLLGASVCLKSLPGAPYGWRDFEGSLAENRWEVSICPTSFSPTLSSKSEEKRESQSDTWWTNWKWFLEKEAGKLNQRVPRTPTGGLRGLRSLRAGGPGLPVTGGTGPLRVTHYIFNTSRDKTDKKGFLVVRKVSSSLHFVNVSYNSGNCLRNSFNIHIGTKQLPRQMGPTTSSSAVPITLKDRCAVYENNL